MTTPTTSTITANKNEWLEFISFAERALGSTDPILLSIKQKNITNNGTGIFYLFTRTNVHILYITNGILGG